MKISSLLFICALLISTNLFADEQADIIAEKFGYKTLGDLIAARDYCLGLYNKYVTAQYNSLKCDTFDMDCMKKQARIIVEASNRLMSSSEWNNYNCTNVVRLFVSSSKCEDNQESGEVMQEDVCGSGNIIIESKSGWYVAAEHYSGSYFSKGDTVCADDFTSYGFEKICKGERCGSYYIEDYELKLEEAYKELCH